MDKLELHEGGFPLQTETLDFLQNQTKMVANLAALGGTDTYILSGVKIEGDNVTDGVIVYKGEILPFIGGPKQDSVTIIEETEEASYLEDANNDGLGDLKPAYIKRNVMFGTSGVESFSFSELKPFINGLAGEIFGAFFKDVRLPYVGLIEDIPEGWEICELLKGKFPVVYDASQEDYNEILKTGGADKVQLTEEELPSHKHSGTTLAAGSHKHNGSISSGGNHNHSGTTNQAGSHKHTGVTNLGGSHKHDYKDSYFCEAYTSPQNYLAGFGADYIGTNLHGSGDTDGDNHYIWYRNKETLSDGNHSHTLNMNNAGAHTHPFTTANSGNHTHNLNLQYGGSHSHSFNTNNSGGNQEHENRPSFRVIAMIKYVG